MIYKILLSHLIQTFVGSVLPPFGVDFFLSGISEWWGLLDELIWTPVSLEGPMAPMLDRPGRDGMPMFSLRLLSL